MVNNIKKMNTDIEQALNNQLKNKIDEYNLQSSPYNYDLMLCEDGDYGKWVKTNDGIINYAMGQSETLIFNIGFINVLEYKQVTNVKLDIEYSIKNNAGSVPVFAGASFNGFFVESEIFLSGDNLSFDCGLFGLDEDKFNSLLHNGVVFNLVFDGNLSNAHIILSKLVLNFTFNDGFLGEENVVWNRVEGKVDDAINDVEGGVVDDVYSKGEVDYLILNNKGITELDVDDGLNLIYKR